MGGGILPVAKHNGTYYLLFSRERLIHNRDRDRGKWSDFGGGTEKNESSKNHFFYNLDRNLNFNFFDDTNMLPKNDTWHAKISQMV